MNASVSLFAVDSTVSHEPRAIVLRTRGHRHGPIVRMVSPSDIGHLIKPFIFLDFVDVDQKAAPRFGYHPHSGIATLTLLLDGGFAYEDSTGASGTMDTGAVEWMQAGAGVWHTGQGVGKRIKGYQLWVALPAELELAPSQSLYLGPDRFPTIGPARVILGEYLGAKGPIPPPSPMNYLDVRLKPGESWRYEPPSGHQVAWVAVHEGTALTPDPISAGELAVFAEGNGAITLTAKEPTNLVLGSAVKHPHDLVMGYYSVHTTANALKIGESRIEQIAEQLRGSGKL
jgi:redox-sensitive bicupin YhaK (pirin superfamily)